MNEHHQRPRLLMDAADYQHIAERFDEASLQDAYVGRWSDRESFGQFLLADTGALTRLKLLPAWLRPYVKLDGTGFVAELEREGVYTIADITNGICVLDTTAVRAK